MTSATASQPPVERRKQKRQTSQARDYGWELYLIIVTVALAAGFFVSYDQIYKPGDNVGYNIGLVGGIMMVTLLIYPLRKRVGFMRNWSILPRWFKWHMIFGVLGPALILFHSTFMIASINAGVAMVCMLMVSGSGIFGRFFYKKIHQGLYGRQSSLQHLQSDLDGSGDVKSVLSFAPEIEKKLEEYRDKVLSSSKAGKLNGWNFISLGFRMKYFEMGLVRELEDVMYMSANAKQWNEAQMKRLDDLFYQNVRFIRSYLVTVRDLAQFSTYEKLFSLWHIFHVPLVYMLVFSSIWHVISVHKY